MSDSLKGKNGKVRVMYVRSDEEEAPRRPATQGRDGAGQRGDAPRRDEGRNSRDKPSDRSRPPARRDGADTGSDSPWKKGRAEGERSGDRPRNDGERSARSDRGARGDRTHPDAVRNPRTDRNRPSSGRADDARSASGRGSDSPWKTSWQTPDEPAVPDHGGISGKSFIDPEQLRRQRAEETRVYGENACLALFKNRPDSIVRAWFVQSVTPRFRDALRWMAANRKAYHVVEDDELAKASGTEHHGGVCFLIKKRVGLDASGYLQTDQQTDCVLALEEVANPHNLGAILRSCAHFGVKGVMMADSAMLESGAAVRTAEGGAEHITSIQTDDLLSDLTRFREAGYTIVTTSSHQGTPLASVDLPLKMVLVLGQESTGLSEAVLQQADLALSIGGTGRVESLNVSVATGILLAEWWRQHH